MIDYLVTRNHKWDDILDGYSINVVRNLFNAGKMNDKLNHLEKVTGLSMAVTNAIDLTFNKGKSKVLDNYIKVIKDSMIKKEPVKKGEGTRVSKSVMDFFNSLPKIEEKVEDADSG